MSIQVNAEAASHTIYQPLPQSSPETILSRISKRFTIKNVAILAIGTSALAVTAYLLVHGKASGNDNTPFPHDGLFSYYCKEACNTLYGYNPELVQDCDTYCEGSSKDTFPRACVLACNKLGIDVLLKCIQSCN